MTLIFLAGLTPFGYAFIGVILLSFLIAYLWLKSSNKKQKGGCLSLGLAALLIGFALMFPVSFSFAIIENGNKIGIIGVAVFWVLILGLVTYFFIAKKTTAVKNVIFSIIKYCFFIIALGLFLTLVFGMIYYIYVRLFTLEKKDDPIWPAFLCIFFIASLILAGYGLWIRSKDEKKKEKSTFYNLEEAKLKSELVIELDLSKQELKIFPEEILQFKNLKFLVLSHNEIRDIPNEINKLQKLVGLDLSNNPISDLERSRIRKLLSTEVEIVF
ncbi:leucine-rich repeat domain-containing protein [Flavobacterium panacagri]|uniref:leucine-rich repeat domain-containing protein n=1 Tax=Flavobacterium panacagri TaxID=3034146 RepID=UPI0025A659E1|nr:leucine-rich repeat domain-containing protein [Flavobacterium panacagri]